MSDDIEVVFAAQNLVEVDVGVQNGLAAIVRPRQDFAERTDDHAAAAYQKRVGGVAERALEMLCIRAQQRVAFGRRLSEQGVTLERIADARILIDQARWLVLNAAFMMDTVGNRAAKKEIAMIKVAAPNMACQVIDWAIQVHGGGGVSDDFPLAAAYAAARTLRFADGPDEVHREQIGKLELARHRPSGAAAAPQH